MYPITAAGKAIAGITMVLGILIIALPITILGQKFSEAYEENKDSAENSRFVMRHFRKEYKRRILLIQFYVRALGKSIRRFERALGRAKDTFTLLSAGIEDVQPSTDMLEYMREHDVIAIDFDIFQG
jgi:hypothetical protein